MYETVVRLLRARGVELESKESDEGGGMSSFAFVVFSLSHVGVLGWLLCVQAERT